MTEPAPHYPETSLYEIDFDCWAREQAMLLRSRQYKRIDIENLAEEIEDLSRRQRQKIESQLIRLLFHLLKWRYQPEHRSGGWKNSILDARYQIQRIVADSPSLRSLPAQLLEKTYVKARRLDPENPVVESRAFPEICPWTVEQILDEDWLP
jgi:iron-sulfur cluster repair protein YtfE (RIC family)